MKFKTEKLTRMVPLTINGVTNDVPEEYEVKTPVLPRNWNAIAIKAAVVLVLALTGIAVAWSTISIGSLLGGGVGLLAAVLFDLAWIINILLEHLARYDADKRKFPRRMGWALLLITMGAIFWHGMLAGSVALAVVGALVSMVAKMLWMGIMTHVHREVRDPKLRAWIKQEREKADAKVILADVRRTSAEAEHGAVLELLAAEKIRKDIFGEDAADVAALLSALPAQIASAPAPDAVSADRAPAAALRGDGAGYPADAVPEQGGPTKNVRPEDTDDRTRNRMPSIASAVRDFVEQGKTDVEYVASALANRYAPDDERKFRETVGRYIRDAKRPADRSDRHDGPYL